jgi:hypothetical protein
MEYSVPHSSQDSASSLPEHLFPALIQRLALGIKRAGLEELVIFVLEAHRPLSGVFSHLAQILTPLVPAALGKEYFELLSDRKNLERLEILLEAKRQ